MKVFILAPSKAQSQVDDAIYVVIDTFRATTSLTTLKHSGVGKIYVVNDKIQAFTIKEHFISNCLLIGEEGGIKVEGFDYGNTPSLFFNIDLENKDVIFTSTSGAKTLIALEKKKEVYLGSLINLSTIANEVKEKAKHSRKPITIVPSGYFNDESIFTIEDWLTAVLLAKQIVEDSFFTFSTKGKFWIKTEQLLISNKSIETLLLDSLNGVNLKKMGFENDAKFSIKIDIVNNFLKVKKWESFGEIKAAILE